jgi:hypothetical protein
VSDSLNEAVIALLALGGLVLWWHSSVQSRERARHHARGFCQRQGWQLLDQTVALSSMRPRRQRDGWRLWRRYRFEFSPDGGRRRSGDLVLLGRRLERISAEIDGGGRLIE